MLFLVALCLISCTTVYGLDNGLALTPPMGWMSWQRFRCLTDCDLYPDECVSDKLFRKMADLMVLEGYLAAGYEYLIIDDCWLSHERDSKGRLQPDPQRFPYGIKNLSDYVHSKGLKFGMYENFGGFTCKGYPGLIGHLEEDAKTFAEWQIDYIKIDGCNASVSEYKDGYTNFGRYLNGTGRPIVYSCSWPYYIEKKGILPDYKYMGDICNLWRSTFNIQDSYLRLSEIIDWYKNNQDRVREHSGVGHWNDPDMLIIGSFGLSYEQCKTQMAIWSILAAPLLMSVDFRTVESKEKAILLNKDAIAINQDSLGVQGWWVTTIDSIDVWIRPVNPIINKFKSYAVAFHSRRDDGYAFAINVNLNILTLPHNEYENHLNIKMLFLCALFLLCCTSAYGLDNGLALTPPMGWMSWQRFRCITDCDLYPDECISDKLFRKMADLMSSEGYLAAGYEYLIIDDCWLSHERDARGRLQPDPKRFPFGMKSLADYVHRKGLKFGMYENFGGYTCAGYPGIIGHLEEDAKTFAEWEIDYIKIDGCNASVSDYKDGYTDFGRYLNATNRPIVYSCSWPYYIEKKGILPDYGYLGKICNLWRSVYDIQDSYRSLSDIIDWYKKNQDRVQKYGGVGHWNDPDMLIIGNFGLSYEQSKTQMALWAILAAPLLMSVDFTTIPQKEKALLLNKDVIAINQDSLGIQGWWVTTINSIDVWIRPINPIIKDLNSYAVAFHSRRDDGYPFAISANLKKLTLPHDVYMVTNVLEPSFQKSIVQTNTSFIVRIKPSSTVLYKFVPVVF
ncbi:hypothetical protein FQR65_LT04441 [Abscondita terminalis]|nr:hypothetical protein FQR65_LT04441 [Abscondita terminalis]